MKTRTSLSVMVGALVALGSGTALARGSSNSGSSNSGSSYSGSQSAQSSQGQGASAQGSSAGTLQGMGVIQKVNSKQNKLTLIVPEDVSTTYKHARGFSELSRELDMASISVPVAKDAQVQLDGQQASLKQLKMGDSVRVSFDPQQKKIVAVQATSFQNNGQGSTQQGANTGSMQPGSNPAGNSGSSNTGSSNTGSSTTPSGATSP